MSERLQTRTFVSNWWTVDLPATWRAKEEAECTTFQTDASPGVLLISAARKPDGDVTRTDALDFAKHATNLSPYMNVLEGFYRQYEQNGHYWKEWWLFRKSVLLFVTYNMKAFPPQEELQVIDQIVASIRISEA